MDVNRRIFICDRIEIRIKDVISSRNDIIYPENAHFWPNVTLNVFNIYDEKRRCKMPERYKPDEAAHSVTVGKTTFVVNSFTDTQATVTAEELIIKMLKSKVAEVPKEEKTA